MIIFQRVLLVLSLLLFQGSLFAAEELKIGVVDISFLMKNISEKSGINQQLDEEFAKTNKILKEISQEIIRTQNQRNKEDVSENIRELDKKIINLRREFGRVNDEYQQDYNFRRNEELYSVQKQIADAILEFSKKNNYDLILESGMIYAKDSLNVTDQVLELLRSKIK